jgi:hypothetical protein
MLVSCHGTNKRRSVDTAGLVDRKSKLSKILENQTNHAPIRQKSYTTKGSTFESKET